VDRREFGLRANRMGQFDPQPLVRQGSTCDGPFYGKEVPCDIANYLGILAHWIIARHNIIFLSFMMAMSACEDVEIVESTQGRSVV